MHRASLEEDRLDKQRRGLSCTRLTVRKRLTSNYGWTTRAQTTVKTIGWGPLANDGSYQLSFKLSVKLSVNSIDPVIKRRTGPKRGRETCYARKGEKGRRKLERKMRDTRGVECRSRNWMGSYRNSSRQREGERERGRRKFYPEGESVLKDKMAALY